MFYRTRFKEKMCGTAQAGKEYEQVRLPFTAFPSFCMEIREREYDEGSNISGIFFLLVFSMFSLFLEYIYVDTSATLCVFLLAKLCASSFRFVAMHAHFFYLTRAAQKL